MSKGNSLDRDDNSAEFVSQDQLNPQNSSSPGSIHSAAEVRIRPRLK